MTDCVLCANNERDGWWGVSGVTHCRDCHRTWTSARQQHCAECCRHFSGETAAEKHRSHDRCKSDRTLERRGLYKTSDKLGTLWRHKPPASPPRSWQTGESGR